MKLPRTSVRWIDGAGILILALITAALHVALIRPALELRAGEEELHARLTSMRSNLSTLRARAREFEGRVEEARQIAETQPRLERSDALLTRRAALTSLLAEHNLLLDEFENISPSSAAERRPGEPDAARPGAANFVRHRLTLRGEGTFPDIVAMTSAVRAQFADTLIEAIEVTGHPLGSSDQRRFTLKLVWYASRSEGA